MMRAAIYNGPQLIGVAERPDPVITAPTDAVVRVVPFMTVRFGPLLLPRPDAARSRTDQRDGEGLGRLPT
jgi:hypothetical protein